MYILVGYLKTRALGKSSSQVFRRLVAPVGPHGLPVGLVGPAVPDPRAGLGQVLELLPRLALRVPVAALPQRRVAVQHLLHHGAGLERAAKYTSVERRLLPHSTLLVIFSKCAYSLWSTYDLPMIYLWWSVHSIKLGCCTTLLYHLLTSDITYITHASTVQTPTYPHVPGVPRGPGAHAGVHLLVGLRLLGLAAPLVAAPPLVVAVVKPRRGHGHGDGGEGAEEEQRESTHPWRRWRANCGLWDHVLLLF